jgi:hypothetical protein
LGIENAFNTISRLSFLAELYKNPDLQPIIPLLEMIYSRDSTVYHFDPNDASRVSDKGDHSWPLLFNLAIGTPPPD